MIPTIIFDRREFSAALRQIIAKTSRTIPQVLNARLFFVLARAFLFLRPASPQAERKRIHDYLTQPLGDINKIRKKTGKKVATSRLFRRVNLIVQARNKEEGGSGLYGKEMQKLSGWYVRRAINTVGYLAAPVAKAIKSLQGHFSQFGGTAGTRAKARPYAGNAALLKLADQYNITDRSNINLFKGAHAYTRNAKPGLRPIASADMAIEIKNDQVGRVDFRYNDAANRALVDEHKEMLRHLAGELQPIADEHNARKA